jgi:hypothetical protein
MTHLMEQFKSSLSISFVDSEAEAYNGVTSSENEFYILLDGLSVEWVHATDSEHMKVRLGDVEIR